MRILLIEDEKGLSDALCESLKKENYNVCAMYDGQSGLDEALTDTYDVIILDIMLPLMNGYEVLKNLRKENIHTPVLLLTAKAEIEDKVVGLDAGADYYLTKPFATKELFACIRALTRRPETMIENDPQFGDLILKTQQSSVYCTATNKTVKMGLKELNLLEILMKNAGNILPKETLAQRVWGFESDAEYNNVEVYISFVRKKLQFIGSNTIIKSTRGLGYSLEVNV